MGLFRAVRQLMREYLNFGNEELRGIQQQLEKQRANLQQLKVMSEQRKEHEEKLALLELRRAIQHMQKAEQQSRTEETAIIEAVGQLEHKMRRMMEAELEGKAMAVMQAIDYHQVLTGEKAPPERQATAGGAPPEAPSEAKTSSRAKPSSSKGRLTKNKK